MVGLVVLLTGWQPWEQRPAVRPDPFKDLPDHEEVKTVVSLRGSGTGSVLRTASDQDEKKPRYKKRQAVICFVECWNSRRSSSIVAENASPRRCLLSQPAAQAKRPQGQEDRSS